MHPRFEKGPADPKFGPGFLVVLVKFPEKGDGLEVELKGKERALFPPASTVFVAYRYRYRLPSCPCRFPLSDSSY